MNISCFRAAIGAAALAIPLAASAASFIVLGSPGADLDAAVRAAGGKVTNRLLAIDAVVADGDAAFKSRIQRQPGVQSVAPNLNIRWTPSEQRRPEAVADAPLDPPNNPLARSIADSTFSGVMRQSGPSTRGTMGTREKVRRLQSWTADSA